MILRCVFLILFLALSGFAVFFGFKGTVEQDQAREDKWAEYEHRKKH